MDVTILWDLEEDESGNVAHIAERDLDKKRRGTRI
jgi:hypothetical protein